MAYNEKGEEILDQTPVELPLNFKRPQTLQERIADITRLELMSLDAAKRGEESFEEADDFDVPDDVPLPGTPWEEDFDPIQKFIGSREHEIRHGAVKDFSDEKIELGRKEYEAYMKAKSAKTKSKRKPKAEPRESQEDELDSDDDTE